jgi:multiple sugar transport system ATP-binding protein
MGRAIVRDPQVFLFDEPLSNLDAKLRVAMRSEIKELHQRLKTTSIYVTHDQIEAMTMGDKIVVMRDGSHRADRHAAALYDHPANQFVAGFIGSPAMNFLPGTLRRGGAGAQVELPDGTLLAAPRASGGATASRSCSARGPSTSRSPMPAAYPPGRRDGADRHGHLRRLPPRGIELSARVPRAARFSPGSTIHLVPDQRARICSTPAPASGWRRESRPIICTQGDASMSRY